MSTKMKKSNTNNQALYYTNSENLNINRGSNQINSNLKSSEKLISPNSQVFKFCKNLKDINKQNENGYTPVYCSILSENIDALNELLAIGANPNIPNFLNETPLYLSVEKNNLDSLIILLKYNADCNIQTKKGNTPLHLAIQKNLDNFIHILLRNKANPNIKNKLYGQTAAHLVIINRLDEDILKLLKECNADIFYIKDKNNKSAFDYAKNNNDEYYIHLLIKIFGNNLSLSKNKYIVNQMHTWNEKKISKHLKNIHDYDKNNISNNYYNQNYILNNTDRYKYNFHLDKSTNNKNKFNNKNIKNNNYSINSETRRNEFKSEENNSYISTNKMEEDKKESDKKIYSHGRGIISSDLCSNNIQIKELNNSSENNSLKSKKSFSEFLEDEMNNIGIVSYKPNFSETNDNKENFNINKNKDNISQVYSIKSENSNISGLSKIKNIRNSEKSNNNSNSKLFNFSHSSSKNKSNDSQNIYQTNSNSICANRKIIKSIINDTVKKIVVKTISSSEGDNEQNPNTNLLSKDSYHNLDDNESDNQIEKIQIKDKINMNQNEPINNIDNKNDNFNIETNNFQDNTVNLYENGTTSFVLYKSKNSNEINNNIMLNNLGNNNDKKTINISNIYEEININTNSNKSNANDYIADNNINRNKTINLKNINYNNNQKNNSNNKDEIKISTNSINSINNQNYNNSDLKDNMFLASTNSHIFSELNKNSNNNNLTNNNISLSYSKNLQSEEENNMINSNDKISKDSEDKKIKEYTDKTNSKIFYNSNLDLNIVEPNEEKIELSNDNYEENKINKSIYKNNNFKNSISSNTFHGSNCTIKNITNQNNKNHHKKISNGKIISNTNLNKEINSSAVLKKSKSFMDSKNQKGNNFNKSTYNPSEFEKNNQDIKDKNNQKNIYKKHHRQLSYHLNYKSYLNSNKEKEIQKNNINIINNNNKENINFNTNSVSASKNDIIYRNKNNMINSLINNSSNKSKKSNINNIDNNNLLSENNLYNINQTSPKETINKEISISPGNKSIRSTNKINSTVTHKINNLNINNNESNINMNLNINNQSKRNRISSVANTTNNTAFSTINRQKNSPSRRPSKFTNKINIPVNNKYNSNNDDIEDLEEELCDSSKLKNIPTDVLIKLRDWLISCDLLCYYNLFIARNMYNIDTYIHDIQEGTISLTYKDIEKLGIKKPGHIFRILIKLEIDAGIIDSNLFDYIVEKINYESHTTTIALTSSINNINCCGINLCSNENNNHNKNINNRKSNNNILFNDLSSFLRVNNIYKFKGNFLYNGFDKIEYIIIQLFTKYAFNKKILTDCLHVYLEKDKIKLLKKLYMIKKNIAKDLEIEIDEDEINKMIYPIYRGNKFEKNKNHLNSNNVFNQNNSSSNIKKSLSIYYSNNSSIRKSSNYYSDSIKSKNKENRNNDSNYFCQIF